MNFVQSTYAIAAAPIGNPGWPEFAFSTASTAKKRIVLIQSWSSSPGDRSVSLSLDAVTAWLCNLVVLLTDYIPVAHPVGREPALEPATVTGSTGKGYPNPPENNEASDNYFGGFVNYITFGHASEC